jgi:hypothetical protein
MVWFAPSSKPVTLTPSRARCQIKSELVQFIVLGIVIVFAVLFFAFA